MNTTQLFKKITWLAVGLTALLVAGCSGFEQNTCYEGVKKKYPTAEVAMIPDEKYRFIVKTKNGDILYVETMNFSNGDVTESYTAFRGN